LSGLGGVNEYCTTLPNLKLPANPIMKLLFIKTLDSFLEEITLKFSSTAAEESDLDVPSEANQNSTNTTDNDELVAALQELELD